MNHDSFQLEINQRRTRKKNVGNENKSVFFRQNAIKQLDSECGNVKIH